jgi:hypothetical protein
MKRGPQPGIGRVDFLAKARAAWGDELPAEIEALASACNETTATGVARQVGVSTGLVSHLLAKRYPGDVVAVFAKIRGALIGERVACPILGDIRLDHCLVEQKRPFAATNSTRARLYHACRTCPNRRDQMEPSHDQID